MLLNKSYIIWINRNTFQSCQHLLMVIPINWVWGRKKKCRSVGADASHAYITKECLMFRYIRHLCLVFLSVHALGDSSSLNDKRNIGLDACRAAFTRYLWNLVVTYGPLLGYIAYITSYNSCFSSFSPTHAFLLWLWPRELFQFVTARPAQTTIHAVALR